MSAIQTKLMKTALTFYCTIAFAFLLPIMSNASDLRECFIPGEVSEYKVTWFRIPLAWSKSTTDTVEENGRELIRLRMVSKTYKAYSHIYKVDDVIEILIDPVTGLPVRQDIETREGDRHKSQLTTFDHKNRTATYLDRIAGTTNSVAIEADTLEIYSYIYSLRNRDLKELENNKHKLFVEGEIHDFSIKIGKERNIKLPTYGKVESIAVEPIAAFNGLFLRQGKITFWISKEKRRMITSIKAKVPIGKITVTLQSVTGPGEDFWVRSKK